MYKQFRIAKLIYATSNHNIQHQTIHFVSEWFDTHDQAVDALEVLGDNGMFIILECYMKENSH